MRSDFALGSVWGLLSLLNAASGASWMWAQSRKQGLLLVLCPMLICARGSGLSWDTCYVLDLFQPPGSPHGNGFPQEAWVPFLLRGLWIPHGCIRPGGVLPSILRDPCYSCSWACWSTSPQTT